MQRGKGSSKEILREEKAKRGWKRRKSVERSNGKDWIKARGKRGGELLTETLLDSGATGLVMSKEFVKEA